MAQVQLRSNPSQPGRLRGVALTVIIAAVAALLGAQLPVIGGPVFGILFGMLVAATGRIDASFRPGIAFSSRQLLQYSIVLLGAGLSLSQIVETGAGSLTVMLSTLFACLLAAWLLGRALSISSPLTTLIGVGTAICGGSAIAAVSSVMESEEKDVAYAISTIFFFNVIAAVLFPHLGRLVGLSQEGFGLFAGTAINDTSSVVAAAYTYGQEAGVVGTVVKLTRTTLIIPIVLALATYRAAQAQRQGANAVKVGIRKLIPWFILWFLAAALLNTAGLLPDMVVSWAAKLGKFLIVVALTAVGLSARFGEMARAGLRPLLLGFLLSTTVTVVSLAAQYLTGRM